MRSRNWKGNYITSIRRFDLFFGQDPCWIISRHWGVNRRYKSVNWSLYKDERG